MSFLCTSARHEIPRASIPLFLAPALACRHASGASRSETKKRDGKKKKARTELINLSLKDMPQFALCDAMRSVPECAALLAVLVFTPLFIDISALSKSAAHLHPLNMISPSVFEPLKTGLSCAIEYVYLTLSTRLPEYASFVRQTLESLPKQSVPARVSLGKKSFSML